MLIWVVGAELAPSHSAEAVDIAGVATIDELKAVAQSGT